MIRASIISSTPARSRKRRQYAAHYPRIAKMDTITMVSRIRAVWERSGSDGQGSRKPPLFHNRQRHSST